MHLRKDKLEAMAMDELDALSLEYKRDYGVAVRNLDITDVLTKVYQALPLLHPVKDLRQK